MSQPGYVFPKNVKFDIHHRAHLYVAEVGILSRIRNDSHREAVVSRLADRQRHSVHRHAALVHTEIASVPSPGLLRIGR